MLYRFADGNRSLLPDRALAILDRLPALGLTAEDVATIRDGMVLAKALVPEGFDDYITSTESALTDARFIALNKRCWEAAAWEADDPRVEKLATAVANHFLSHPALLNIVTGLQASTEAATRYRLISEYGKDRAPAWARLNSRIERKLRLAGVAIPHK